VIDHANATPTDAVQPTGGGIPRRDWSVLFLDALAETGNAREAAARAGISPSTAYRRTKTDEAFRDAWAEAREIAYEAVIVAEMVRRAVEGYEEPLAHQGVLTGETVTRYSDRLLMRLEEINRPADRRAAEEVVLRIRYDDSPPPDDDDGDDEPHVQIDGGA
jgi:hypothetical protein